MQVWLACFSMRLVDEAGGLELWSTFHAPIYIAGAMSQGITLALGHIPNVHSCQRTEAESFACRHSFHAALPLREASVNVRTAK